MISKSTFEEFSLPHHNGSYFLRPDRILAAFRVDHSIKLTLSTDSIDILTNEKLKEIEMIDILKKSEDSNQFNITRIDITLATLWKSLNEVSITAEDDDQPGGEHVIDRRGSSLIDMIRNTVSSTATPSPSSSSKQPPRRSKVVDLFQTYRNSRAGAEERGSSSLMNVEMSAYPKSDIHIQNPISQLERGSEV